MPQLSNLNNSSLLPLFTFWLNIVFSCVSIERLFLQSGIFFFSVRMMCLLVCHSNTRRIRHGSVQSTLTWAALHCCLCTAESEGFILKTDSITFNKHTHTPTPARAQRRFSVAVHVYLWCVLFEALFVLPMLDQVGWNLLCTKSRETVTGYARGGGD